jgi:GNAT superfamily N-acetyltransferase
MKNDIFIRGYKLKDYNDLANAGYPFSTADWGSVYKDLKLKIINVMVLSEEKKLVAYSFRDKKAVGIVTLKKITNSLWGVWHIFVSPDYRRRGIALSLYEKSFDYLRKRKVKRAVGSVEVTNIPSVKSIEKVWNEFLPPKIFEFRGNLPHSQKKRQMMVAARRFRSSDHDALFEIYKQCAHREWYTFLEINRDNFLQRLVEPKYYRGPLRILLQKQILVFESKDRTLIGYAIARTPKWSLRRQGERSYFIVSPQLSPDETVDTIIEMLSFEVRRHLRNVISMFTINKNEKMLLETSKMLCADFNFEVFQSMVPVKRL